MNLWLLARIINFDQKFLALHQGMHATVIQHTRMDKHILGNILGSDKSISANIIEKFHYSTQLTIFRFGCGRWRRVDGPVNAQQILNHLTMLIDGL